MTTMKIIVRTDNLSSNSAQMLVIFYIMGHCVPEDKILLFTVSSQYVKQEYAFTYLL
jgi:hypothetical protein